MSEDGIKIQVKSLRVSRENPEANGLDWRCCTRVFTMENGKPKWGERIDAHRLAVVVFYDFRPYASWWTSPSMPGKSFRPSKCSVLAFVTFRS